MTIYEPTFVQVLHTMDQSWYAEDLNDDGLSFHMRTWWHGAPIVKHNYILKKKPPYNSHLLGEKIIR